LRRTTSFDVLSVNVRAGVSMVDDWKNPQKRMVNMQTSEGVYFAYVGRRNPWTDRVQILCGYRDPWRNHVYQISWR